VTNTKGVKMKNKVFKLIMMSISIILILFLIIPILKMFTHSTLEIFYQSAKEKEVIDSIFLTLRASFVATLITIFLGIPLAYSLSRYTFPGKFIVESIINIPLIIPHSAAGIALLTVFGDQFIGGRFFSYLGISFTGNFAGIVIAMMFVSMPFLINESKEGFNKIDERYEKVARTLGASPFQSFFKIVLPMNKNHILSGTLMMWARGISEFGAVLVLAYHPMTAPVLIYERFTSYGLKYSVPVAGIMIIITTIVFTLLKVIQKKDVIND